MRRSWRRATLAFVIAVVAAPLLISAFPAGTDGEDTGEILQRWADSLGGLERLEAAKTIHLRMNVKMFGMDGTIDEWAAEDGRHHMGLDLGGLFHVESVFDGQDGWQLDQNGKVSQLSGADLRGEITAAYLASWSYLLKGRLPGTAEYLGTEEDTGLQVVRFHPDNGDSVTFYLDPERYLPVRSEQPQRERTLTTTYSDWRSVDGILFPGAFTQSTGDPQYNISGELAEAIPNAVVPEATFKKPAEAANDVQFTEGTSALGIPIEMNTVHIFLQARVNGSDPLWFVLDTGAGATALNTATASSLGFNLEGKIEGRGAGEGSVEVNLVPDVSFELPGVKLVGQTVATVPLSRIEELMGRPIDGIFGYDFISRFVVQIDYENLKLNLYDRKSYKYGGEGAIVPMELEDNTPRVEGTVTPPGREPISCRLLVDTGASGAVGFARPFTEKNDLLSALTKKFFHESGFGIGGASKSYVGRMSSVEVGGLDFRDPVCDFSMDEGGAGADPDNAGLLGGEILSRCTVTFDYDRGHMILEPNSKFGTPFQTDMSGIRWTTGGRGDFNSFTVLAVLADSPGAAAGVEVGDKLVSIDGAPADGFTSHALYEYFRQDGREVQLTLDRSGERISKTLRLKPLI
jgi:hypothetical protein